MKTLGMAADSVSKTLEALKKEKEKDQPNNSDYDKVNKVYDAMQIFHESIGSGRFDGYYNEDEDN